NDLERFIRKLKVAYRETIGRASCQGYIVWYGVYVCCLMILWVRLRCCLGCGLLGMVLFVDI
ncbi:MAG: hypothetical protein WDA42_04145, partial [Candidatus Bathyarchaeia archaeon]